MTDSERGALYVVSTPIGNLEDLSRRALDTLRDVNLILCEDTRRTRVLLNQFGIENRCLSFHDHNERQRSPEVIRRLEAGERVALVSDSGTPTISDPGYHLIHALSMTGIPVIPIPGPTAVIAILSVAGLPTDRFVFEGFLPPRGSKRNRRLNELAEERRTIVLYESPHRIAGTLKALLDALGDRPACLGRELTKKFEEILHAPLSELLQWAGDRKIKGEIVLAIAGRSDK